MKEEKRLKKPVHHEEEKQQKEKKLSKHYRYNLIEEAVDKLGQLEDIEEELGIDLITLFKAISNEKGIWKKVYGTKDFVNTRAMLTCEFGKWRIYDKEWIYELKDYGKTWWLEKPKDELENE